MLQLSYSISDGIANAFFDRQTTPLESVGRYRSVSCIDCVEHLDDAQVAGLFANTLRVERQAFSIHTGPRPPLARSFT